jgi:hypothetical protein
MKVTPNRLMFFVTALVLALQCGLPANAATVVFDNISPTTPYYFNFGSWLGTLGNQYEITATSFTRHAGDASRLVHE